MGTLLPITKRITYLALLFSLVAFMQANAQMSVQSPDGKITVTVSLSGQKLSYIVEKSGATVMSSSPLGITADVADFTTGLTFVSSDVTTIDETYTLPSGKRSTYRNNCKELTVRVSKGAVNMNMIFRAYNDGFAYRYT